MALEPTQQFEKLLLGAKNVLIFLPQDPDGDAIGAGWALYFFLRKKSIDSTVAFTDEAKNAQRFQFLPAPENVTASISGARDFVLSFNTRLNKITDVKTEKNDDEFRIFITPERGAIDPRDFSFIPAKFKYDLVITLGSPDKESLGKLYEDNPDIFYEVPVVNIDCHSGNENFGQINIVELTASSVSEILAGVLERIDSLSLDQNIAECLLAGIISATDSFQKKNTTPQSLQIAAQLMDRGADQQKIVRYLYKTQPFNVLKLWGRIMARLKWDEALGLIWAPVYLEDFVQSRSTSADIPLILEKIRENYSAGRIFLVFYNETENIIAGAAKCAEAKESQRIAEIFSGELAQNIVKFKIEGKNMIEAEQEIIEKLKKL